MLSAAAVCEGRVPAVWQGKQVCSVAVHDDPGILTLEMEWKKQVPRGLVFPLLEKQVLT